MKKELGSDFWLSYEELKGATHISDQATLNFKGSDYVWTSTGRSAISLILESIEETVAKPKKAILPIFTCETVVAPFKHNGYEVFPYYIDKSLIAIDDALCDLIDKIQPSVLLFHNYFGFETFKPSQKLQQKLSTNSTIIIEDCTQTLYSDFRYRSADFYVASIRKWCGVPDGGIAVRRNGKFGSKPTLHDKKLEMKKIEASTLKYEYIVNNKGSKDTFLKAFAEAENILNRQSQVYSISPTSLKIQGDLNLSTLKSKRRENYAYLFEGIRNHSDIKAALPPIADGVTPLFFPIYCNDRKLIQTQLATHSIYAPILWPCPAEFSHIKDRTTRYVYEHLLCIPIDQRYEANDMERILQVLNDEK